MPTEVRRLIFTNTESADALRAYGPKFHIEFPGGALIQSRFSNHPDAAKSTPVSDGLKYQQTPRTSTTPIVVTFFSNNDHVSLTLTQDFVMAALVDYCLNHKIIMPKGSERHVDVVDLHLCLDLTIQSGDPAKAGLSLALDDE